MAEQMLAYPHKQDLYTYRVPTPPRIVVPPPTLNADAIPEFTLSALRHSSYNFLQNVNYTNLVQHNAPLEWTYERRRQAQDILPFMSLGPLPTAKDEGYLRSSGVTMVIGVRQKQQLKLMESILRVAERLGIESSIVDLGDNQDLIRSFQRVTQLINEHLARVHHGNGGTQLGKVLVVCESGNDRSAVVVAAYLMEMHEEVDHIKAMQLCQAQRFCVNFDDTMKRLLQGYWDILCARRAVQAEALAASLVANGRNGHPEPLAPLRSKRALERDEDGDGEMTVDALNQDDVERFGGRVKFAPFKDQEI